MIQLAGELLGSLVSAAVGLALGSVALVAMLGLRRAHARVSRSSEVQAPDGEIWSVRVVYGLGRRLSTRLAGMSGEARRARRRAGRSDTDVGPDEIWHPRRLLDAFDEAAGLVAGHRSNYHDGRISNHVYLSALLEPAVWGAELAVALAGGEERGRIYVVEPTGTFENDPNVTNKRFPGNVTRSYRTRHPLRVVDEVETWEGSSPRGASGDVGQHRSAPGAGARRHRGLGARN